MHRMQKKRYFSSKKRSQKHKQLRM